MMTGSAFPNEGLVVSALTLRAHPRERRPVS